MGMKDEKQDPPGNGSLATTEEEYYLTPHGLLVFTEKYHLKRGYCCQSGCRHCPYGFAKRDARGTGRQPG
jgi:hypothetical protein